MNREWLRAYRAPGDRLRMLWGHNVFLYDSDQVYDELMSLT
jgi:hypothetical protein